MNARDFHAPAAWHLVQTKPRQEFRALQQLQNQGFTCFLPTWNAKKRVRSKLESCTEPLFSGYLFVHLNTADCHWSPIRNTRGVSRMVSFGGRFATLPDVCIEAIRARQNMPQPPLFESGERVAVVNGPFAGLEGIYQLSDGEARALVLIELMNQPQKLKFAVETLRKVA